MWKLESERLYARAWKESDLDNYAELCRDQDVMRFFPSVYNRHEAKASMDKMVVCFAAKGYAYLPCFTKEKDEFVGFVGIMDQEMDGKKFVDIGWRLTREHWGKGYATEMAKCFLEFGFSEKNLDSIYSIAPLVNLPSISVMNKIGMNLDYEFDHPLLTDTPELQRCAMYVKLKDPK